MTVPSDNTLSETALSDSFTLLSDFAALLQQHDDFVICGHVNPDGDCTSSQLALATALQACGKRVRCVSADDTPLRPYLAFLKGAQSIMPAEHYDGPLGAFVAVDVSDKKRMGAGAALLERAAVSFVLDHHAPNERVATYEYIDVDSPSASLIVWEVIKDLLDEPPVACAECVYTGLITDTGGFRYQNATPVAFKAAYDLVSRGVDPSKVAAEIFQNKSRATLLLEAKVSVHLQMLQHDTGALSFISMQDMAETGAQKSDAGALIDVIRSLRGVRVACLLREEEGTVRGSLRSKDDTDVGALARELGGGGHKAAAGFSLELPLPEAVEFMRDKISTLLGATAS